MRVDQVELWEHAGRSVADGNVLGIEQKRAAVPQRCASVRRSSIVESAMTGDLDKAAGTAVRTAACRDGASECRGLVRHYKNLAAASRTQRVRTDRAGWRYGHRLGRLIANAHSATTGRAGGVHDGSR